MSTELLAPFPVMGGATANIVNPATGDTYTLSARGSVFVADVDVPYFLTQGYIKPSSGGGGGGGGGGGTGVSFDTRAAAIAATVPSTTDVIMTGGYAAPGDGGHALYKRTSSIVYPTYGFTSADGSHWEYIPEPTGWNARAAGVVADSVTDDAANLMNALLPFQNSNYVLGGGNVTGTLLLPAAVMVLKSLVVHVGSNSAALSIRGQSIGNQGGPISSCFQWQGSGAVAYPTMFMVYGANNFHVESVNFDGASFSPASNLVNCLHFNSDGTVASPDQTLVSAVTAGTSRVFTCTSALAGVGGSPGVMVGAALGVGAGTSNFEIVYVTAVSGATFTATCVHNHASGEKVGKSPPCNGLFVVQCTFGVPSGSQSAGVLCGNQIQTTAQVAEFLFGNCNFIGHLTPGTSYSGIRAIVGGNIKNYSIENCSFVGFNTGVAGEAFSGNVKLSYPTFANSTVVDILANGASNLWVDNYESEANGNAMLIGGGGAGPQGATICQSSYQCGLPTNFYVINWAGNLTLINNTFFSQASTGPTVGKAPRIKCSDITDSIPTGSAAPAGICSIGNYYQFGGPDISLFYDGSDNPLDYLDFSVTRRWVVSQFNDYGDEGRYHNKIGALSIASAAMSHSPAAGTIPPGFLAGSKGDICDTFSSFTVPFTAIQTASAGNRCYIWKVPAHTFITGVVIDVITPFKGTGITGLTVDVGTLILGDGGLLIASNAFSAAATYGLVNADLGPGLAPATRASPLGYTGHWTLGDDQLTMLFLSSGAVLSALSQGSLIVYVMSKRLIPGAGLQPSLLTAPSGRKGRQHRLKRPSLD